MAGSEKTVMTSLRLPPALLARVRVAAEREHRSVAGEIAALLEEAFAARDAAANLRRAGQ